MYTEFFGLKSSPFHLSPDPHFMIASEKNKEALASISEAIRLGKGFVVMTGEVGTGKTLVLRCLFEMWEREKIPFAYFIGPRLSTVDFLSYITFELGIQVEEPGKGNLLRALYGFFLAQFEKGLTTVLIIDEAHQISRSVLEEIRLLTNFETAQQKLVQIVLVGQPELDKKLDLAELRSLKQRIAARCRLEPLGESEIRNYIERRLEIAGAGSQSTTIFPEDTIRAVYRYSRGIPRLVNSICDQGLIAAHARQVRTVPVEVIHEVATQFRLEPAAGLSHADKPSPFASQIEKPAEDKVLEAAPVSSVDLSPATVSPQPAPSRLPVSTVPIVPVPEIPALDATSSQQSGDNVANNIAIVESTTVVSPAASLQVGLPEVTSPDIVTPADKGASIASEAPALKAAPEIMRPAQAIPPTRTTAASKVLRPATAPSLPSTIYSQTYFQSDQIFRESWLSQIRRWLRPGARLALVIGLVVVVPVALATGVVIERRQKRVAALPRPLAPMVTDTQNIPAEQPVPSIHPDAAGSARQLNVGLIEPAAPQPNLPISKAAAAKEPQRARPRPNVVMRGASAPIFKALRESAPGEPPSIVGTQPTGTGLLDLPSTGPVPPGANGAGQLQPPKLLSSTPPIYPSIALVANVHGAVLIDAVVNETGKVTAMKVISGPAMLTQAAMDAVRDWKYAPARLNGRAAPAHVQVRIEFNR